MIPIFKKNILLISLSIFAISIVVYRAIFLAITYDEAWTIDEYVPLDYLEIVNYTLPNANNHLLNTVLIKLIYSFGLENVFLARLPNVLAFIFYLYFAFQLSRTFFEKNQHLLFVILVFNPFLLDFFSLARGYGLSLSLLMGSIWFLFNYVENQSRKFAFLAMLFAAFGVLSSFTTIYYFTALSFVIFWIAFFRSTDKKEWLKLISGCLMIAGALIGILYEPFRKLTESNSLWYGGKIGFYSDTLFTLVNSTMGESQEISFVTLVLNIILILLLIVVILRIFAHPVLNWKWSTIMMTSSILLFLCIIQTMVNHWLFDTNFLVDRTALFLFPLICIWLFSLSLSLKKSIYQSIHKIIFIAFTCGAVVNFAFRFQLNTTITWFQDAHSEEILNYLNNLGKKENRVISFDASWPLRAAILYYEDPKRKTFHFTNFMESEPENLDSSRVEYYIFLSRSISNVGYNHDNEIINNFKRDTLLFFEREKVLVLKNKKPVKTVY